MRLYKLELKRMLSSHITRAGLIGLLLMSAIMAYLPITFVRYGEVDANGQEIKLSGFAAIDKIKETRAEYAGAVTGDKLAHALNKYQAAVEQYGDYFGEDFPLSVYYESIAPTNPFIKILRESNADAETGRAAEISELTEEQARDFYAQNSRHIRDLMRLEQKKYPQIQEKAAAMYDKVKTPFVYYPGYNTDAVDYISLYIFLLALGLTAILAPTFSIEYQTGADDILRCAKYGGRKLSKAKIAAAFTVTLVTSIIGIGIHLLLSCSMFGRDTVQSSMQLFYSCVALCDMSIWQMLLCIAGAGLLSLLAITGCTMLVSALSRTSVLALGLSIGLCILPSILCILPSINALEWFRHLLPSGGVGLLNCFQYALVDFKFLRIGMNGVWSPYVLLIAAAVETPIFILLSSKVYAARGMRQSGTNR